MNQIYAVGWAKTARNDLLQIVKYLEAQSPSGAVSVFKAIKEKAVELDKFAERGRIVPELQNQGVFQYRELVVLHWRLIYKIVGQAVLVVAVLDSRRNLEDILLQRFLGLNNENPLP